MRGAQAEQVWAGVHQALSLLLAFLSLHYCFVLKQADTDCMLERTVDPGVLETPVPAPHHVMWF